MAIKVRVFLFIFLSVCFFSEPLLACPFAGYKKGVYQKKILADCMPKVDTNEVMGRFHTRYEIALNELQYSYPYDLLKTKEQVTLLESFFKKCDSHHEKKAIRKTAKCLKLLIDKNYKANVVGKDRYKHFIETLRLAVNSNDSAHWSDPEMKRLVGQILEDISYSHFTINVNHTPIGYSYFWELMPKELAKLHPADLNAKLLNKTINKIFPMSTPKVFFSRLHRKMHSPAFASWDGAMASVRSKVANYQWEDRHVSLLRMSCPIYGKNYMATLDPIFVQYLNALKHKNQRHLYISNLDTTASVHSKEYKMSKLLLGLSNREEYQKTLLFITLPFDSAFYKQGNLGLLRASYFKETFLNSMLLKQEGFYFPPSLLTNTNFISFLDDMIEQVHKAYFDGREFLERVERCQFIDIAYAHIAKYLIEQNNIDMVNWSCYHGIDRSMSAVAVFDVLLQSLSTPDAHLDSTIYISSWSAMVFYHRHPNTIRTVRCYSAIQKLLEKKADLTLPKTDPEEVTDLAL